MHTPARRQLDEPGSQRRTSVRDLPLGLTRVRRRVSTNAVPIAESRSARRLVAGGSMRQTRHDRRFDAATAVARAVRLTKPRGTLVATFALHFDVSEPRLTWRQTNRVERAVDKIPARGGVAQLVERRTHNPKVGGSSPLAPIYPRTSRPTRASTAPSPEGRWFEPIRRYFCRSLMTDYDDQIIAEFRANAGRVGGHWEGRDLLLLTTTGRKSGTEHTTPVAYTPDGDRAPRLRLEQRRAVAPRVVLQPRWPSRRSSSSRRRSVRRDARHRSRVRSVDREYAAQPNGCRPSPSTSSTPSA